MQQDSPRDREVLLIGAGSWGKNLARCFDTLGALRAILVPTRDEATALSARFPRVPVRTSLAEALADPGVRCVAIATPSSTHFELAEAALKAGKDVLVEKPFCRRAEEAEELVGLAEGAGRVLMVGHLLQYHPCVVRLRRLTESGALGRLLTITCNRLNLGKFRTDDNALFSFAPHDVSLVLSLLGDRLPEVVRCVGASYVTPGVADSSLTTLRFSGGELAQLHVSWLNPFKEQRLTVVGTRGMAVFDDTKPWAEKLVVYRNYMAVDGRPPATEALGEAERVEEQEPLQLECAHFLACCADRQAPRTDGREGLRVMKVLQMAQRSLERDGERAFAEQAASSTFVHPSALVEPGAQLGAGSRVWHFAHVMPGARVGAGSSLGQNAFVASGAVVGRGVKVQNNVSIYDGVELEDDVFVGPSCVFTNVRNPRAEVSRKDAYQKTRVRRGATLGANVTIVCGVTLGEYCFVGAGAVVTKDVESYALVLGNPAHRAGWVGRRGERLTLDATGVWVCPASGERYRETAGGLCPESP